MKNETIIKYTYYSHSDNGYDEKLTRLTVWEGQSRKQRLYICWVIGEDELPMSRDLNEGKEWITQISWVRAPGDSAAAKSLQSCLSLCDPIDSSPPGSPVPGILQARTLEWVAISFSNAWKWKVKVKPLSCVWLPHPMDCSLPGSSVHGIFQARALEWVAIAFSSQRWQESKNIISMLSTVMGLQGGQWGYKQSFFSRITLFCFMM